MTKPKNLEGTAFCLDCGMAAMYERGPGSPLSIKHNPDCPQLDLETCSWCTTEVPDSELHETEDGARICKSCQNLPDAPEWTI